MSNIPNTLKMFDGDKNITDMTKNLDESVPEFDGLLELAGSEGRYQKRLLIYFATFSFCLAFIGSCIPFIFYSPTFMCYDVDRNAKSCTEINACQNPEGYYTIFDKYSLVEKYKLYCENHNLDTWGKSSVFFIGAFLTTILVLSCDYIGRRRGFRGMMMILLIGSFLCVFIDSYRAKIIGMPLMFSSCFGFYSLTYIYGHEISSNIIRRTHTEGIQ